MSDPKPFVLANKSYTSRLLIGTGKYRDFEETRRAIDMSGAEIVTVAIRRTNDGAVIPTPAPPTTALGRGESGRGRTAAVVVVDPHVVVVFFLVVAAPRVLRRGRVGRGDTVEIIDAPRRMRRRRRRHVVVDHPGIGSSRPPSSPSSPSPSATRAPAVGVDGVVRPVVAARARRVVRRVVRRRRGWGRRRGRRRRRRRRRRRHDIAPGG